MSRYVKLPGERSLARSTVDEARPDPIDPTQLRRDLLNALADGPVMKWQLHERLQVNEAAVYQQLQVLKAQRLVKVVGKKLDKRGWALVSWQPPVISEARARALADVDREQATKGPSGSWWARPMSREEFRSAREARDRATGRAGGGTVYRSDQDQVEV